jgi:hypothetical protein
MCVCYTAAGIFLNTYPTRHSTEHHKTPNDNTTNMVKHYNWYWLSIIKFP